MKNLFYLALIAGAPTAAWAQQSTSVVWMQQSSLYGTARYNGSAGALVALGGDGSSSLENPALMNSSTFGGMEFSGHLRNDWGDLKSQGGGFGQAYLAGSWRIHSKTRMSVGLAYQRDAWYPNYWIQTELNPSQSAVEEWISASNGLSPAQLLEQGKYDAYVAYMGYLTEVGSGNSYTAYAEGLPNFRQTRFMREYERTSWSLPVALKTDKFALGLRIERRDGRSQERLSLNESGFNPAGVTASYRKMVVDSTRWGQWTVRLGAALQASPTLRLSAAVQPGTMARVQWDYRNRVTPTATQPESNLTPFELYDEQTFSYQLPAQVQVGAAQTVASRGAICAVWTYTGAVNAVISDPLDYYELGRVLATELRAHHQVRVGGEYRATEEWTIRGGYQWSESGTEFADHSAFQMMGLGAGYQERDWGFDVAYQLTARTGSIKNPATQEDWALNTLNQRLSATYKVRF
ncbi:MAG: hypothetical protein RL157_1421 [Bacteroidota bacterium]